MIDYLKDKNSILIILYFTFLLLLSNNTTKINNSFSDYLEHSKKIEPSMLQVRMSQYKKILQRDKNGHEMYKTHLTELLK